MENVTKYVNIRTATGGFVVTDGDGNEEVFVSRQKALSRVKELISSDELDTE